MLSMKIVFVLGLALTVGPHCLALTSTQSGVPGGLTTLSGDGLKEAEEVLNDSLNKIASGSEGPSYKLGKIISATHQLVSGSLYRYEVELLEGSATKKCNVQIWSQPWLENGIETTFDCPDGKVVRKHTADKI